MNNTNQKSSLESIKLLEHACSENEKVYDINVEFQKDLEGALLNNEELVLESINNFEEDFLKFMHTRLIGQLNAKKALSKAILGFNKIGKREGVISSLFFAGPTGVGKTEIVKALAEYLTGDKNNIVLIQGAEYQESHKISNLFGSAKSYVGYGDAPILSETKLFGKNIIPHKIIQNKNNFSIILVDEAEKMHPKIIQSLLGALNEGKVILSTGKEDNNKLSYSQTTDLTNTIWIFTSNVGADKVLEESNRKSIGFLEDNGQNKEVLHRDIYKKEFENIFSPEFRGRIDYFLTFDSLADSDIEAIIDMNIKKIEQKLKDISYDNIKIILNKDVRDYIKTTVNKDLGARNLTKLISRIIEDKLSELETEGKLETMILIGIKYKKNIILEFSLKDDYEAFEYEQDKVLIKIKGKDISDIIDDTQVQLVDNYLSIVTPLDNMFEIGKYHDSLHHILNILKNKSLEIFVKREDFNLDFNNELKKILPIIKTNFGELDYLSLQLLGYIKIVNQIDKKYKSNGGIKNIDDIIDPFKVIEFLGRIFDYDRSQIKGYIKSKLRRNQKGHIPKKLKKALKNINQIDIDFKSNKRVLIISLTLMQLDYFYYKRKNKYLGIKGIKNLVKYLEEIY